MVEAQEKKPSFFQKFLDGLAGKIEHTHRPLFIEGAQLGGRLFEPKLVDCDGLDEDSHGPHPGDVVEGEAGQMLQHEAAVRAERSLQE